MTDPMTDETPPPGKIPWAREDGFPEWPYEHLVPYYNESMIARKMWVITSTMYRYRHKFGFWPARQTLGQLTKRAVRTREELDTLLGLLDLGFAPVYLFRYPNDRGPATPHYGFTDHLSPYPGPKNIKGKRISE